MTAPDVVMVELDKIQREWFHSDRSYRATMWACRWFNWIVQKSQAGYAIYDNDGEFIPELRVEYGPNFSVKFKDGENAWVQRIGDERHETSDLIYTTQKDQKEWLKTIRYVNPKHRQRLRLP